MLMTTIAKRQQRLICLTNRPAMAQRSAFTSTSGWKLHLMLEANKDQQRKKSTKTHANAAHVNQSIKHELRPAFVNPYTSSCLNVIQQKRCRVFNFSDKYSAWKISRLYFLLSLYLFFWIACVPDGMNGTKKRNKMFFSSPPSHIWMFLFWCFTGCVFSDGVEVVGAALNMVWYPHTLLVEISYENTISSPTPPVIPEETGMCRI